MTGISMITMMRRSLWKALCLLGGVLLLDAKGKGVLALIPNNNNGRAERISKQASSLNNGGNQPKQHVISRRTLFTGTCAGAASILVLLAPKQASANQQPPKIIAFNCLAGQETPDCIGAGKEVIPEGDDEKVVLSWGAFRPTAPSITIFKPTSYNEAMGVLQDQRLAMDEMERLIGEGQLDTAGLLLLRVLPRVTIAGRYLAEGPKTKDDGGVSRNNDKFAFSSQVRSILKQGEVSLTALDRMMKRGIDGGIGTMAVAQLQLLSQLSATKVALDNLIKFSASLKPFYSVSS